MKKLIAGIAIVVGLLALSGLVFEREDEGEAAPAAAAKNLEPAEPLRAPARAPKSEPLRGEPLGGSAKAAGAEPTGGSGTPCYVGVWRGKRGSGTLQFHTVFPQEFAKEGYANDGIAFNAFFCNNRPGTVNVYRLHRPDGAGGISSGDYLYTTDYNEVAIHQPLGFRYEGVVWFAYNQPGPNRVAIWRASMRTDQGGQYHLFHRDRAGLEQYVARRDPGMAHKQMDGIAFYAPTKDPLAPPPPPKVCPWWQFWGC